MKYIRIFFTFLGYLTFTAIIGGATFWYIGYHKAQKKVESTVSLREISMTPEKQPDTTTVSMSVQKLPEFQPISRKPLSASKPKPVRAKTDNKPPKTTPSVSVAPVTYATKKAAPAAIASKPVATAKKTVSARPVKSKAKHSPTASHADLGLPAESTLSFRVTDNGTNPRTGRGIVNVYETTELERQVARRLEDLQQLKEAAELIRNPPVHESGIMKMFRNE